MGVTLNAQLRPQWTEDASLLTEDELSALPKYLQEALREAGALWPGEEPKPAKPAAAARKPKRRSSGSKDG